MRATGQIAVKSYRGESEEARTVMDGDILRVPLPDGELISDVYWSRGRWYGGCGFLERAIKNDAEIIGNIHNDIT